MVQKDSELSNNHELFNKRIEMLASGSANENSACEKILNMNKNTENTVLERIDGIVFFLIYIS